MVSTPGTVRFPAAYDDLDSLIRAANGAQTALNMAGGLAAAATTMTVLSTSAFAASGTLSIDSEIIAYTGTTASTFTGLVRGLDGTAAATHAQNAQVSGYIAAIHHNVLAQAILALEQVCDVLAAVSGAAANGANFGGQVNVGAGASVIGYADAGFTQPAYLLGTPSGMSGFAGLSLNGTNDGAHYNLATTSGGADLYVNRPSGGTFHFREGNSAGATEVLFSTGGGVTLNAGAGGRLRAGAGSPQSVVIGSPGDLWLNTSGGAAQTLWIKESGAATNTGWVAK
jgi:hypothetical protein